LHQSLPTCEQPVLTFNNSNDCHASLASVRQVVHCWISYKADVAARIRRVQLWRGRLSIATCHDGPVLSLGLHCKSSTAALRPIKLSFLRVDATASQADRFVPAYDSQKTAAACNQRRQVLGLYLTAKFRKARLDA
jgi:hypothetical protein